MSAEGLYQFILSCRQLSSHKDRIEKLLFMHWSAGQYRPARAVNAWRGFVTRACKLYRAEALECIASLPSWQVMFSSKTREAVMTALTKDFEKEYTS